MLNILQLLNWGGDGNPMQPKRIIETMSDEELAGLQIALPVEFERRGLTISTAVEALTTNQADVEDKADFTVRFDLKPQYERAIAALTDIGIAGSDDKTPPSLDAISHSITPETMNWLAERARSGIKDELVIAPSLGELKLDQLIRRFDRKQNINTYLWKDLWNKYETGTHNNEVKGWQAVIALNDTRQPRNNEQPINKYGEPGLAYTGLTLKDQRKVFGRDATKLAKQGHYLEGMTIAQLIMLNTQRRLAGYPQLDERTFTRLGHYPTYRVGNFDWVPAASWLRGRLRLFGSEASQGWDRFGIRRVLRIELS